MGKKKINIEFTERQLEALIDLIGTVEATYGCSDPIHELDESDYDADCKRDIRLIDRALKQSGYERSK